MNKTTGSRTNYTLYSSTDGGKRWQWSTGVYGGSSGYSDIILLGNSSERDQTGKARIGIAFQLGHNLEGVEGGGYDIGYTDVTIKI